MLGEPQLPRSWLFVPADRPDRIAKALMSSADAVIVDLEDSIPKHLKLQARASLREALKNVDHTNIFIRINSVESTWWADDVRALDNLSTSGVVIPRCDSPLQVNAVAAALADVDAGRWVVPLLETAAGVSNAQAIGGASQTVLALAFGAGDYSLDIGIPKWPVGEQLPLLVPRVMVVLAARLAGCSGALDTPTPTLRDPGALTDQCRIAASLGFRGKLAIHPDQIETINEAFRPSSSELDHARRVVEAFESALSEGRASISVDDKVVTHAIAAQAREVLSRNGARAPVGRGPGAKPAPRPPSRS